MKKSIYSVYDNVTKMFSPPLLDINNGSMMRNIQDLIARDPNHAWSKFPDNYTLMNIGYWDDEEGIPTADKHQVVAEMIAIKLPQDMEK